MKKEEEHVTIVYYAVVVPTFSLMAYLVLSRRITHILGVERSAPSTRPQRGGHCPGIENFAVAEDGGREKAGVGFFFCPSFC